MRISRDHAETTSTGTIRASERCPANPGSGFEYGWVRGLGSLAFIVGSLAAGQAIHALGLNSIVVGQGILLLMSAAAALLVPEITLSSGGGCP